MTIFFETECSTLTVAIGKCLEKNRNRTTSYYILLYNVLTITDTFTLRNFPHLMYFVYLVTFSGSLLQCLVQFFLGNSYRFYTNKVFCQDCGYYPLHECLCSFVYFEFGPH